MKEEEIVKKLRNLDIDSSDQLEKKELDFWWQKKYKEIKESQLKEDTIKEKLIEINEIYGELNTFDKEELKKILISVSFENPYADSDPDSDPDIVSFLKYADISFENGDYNSAARNYGYAIRYYLQYQEERSQIYYKRGLSKWNSGTFYSKEEILYDLQKAVELDNKNSKYLLTLVDYKFSIGCCSKEEYRKLLNFDGIIEIFNQRGLKNESNGQLENAAFFYSLAEYHNETSSNKIKQLNIITKEFNLFKVGEIKKKLKILGIDSSDQLKKKELDFWWQKKYNEIKESQLKEETIREKLIEINEIFEELNTFDKEELRKTILIFKRLNPKSLLNKGIMHKDRDISYQTVQRTEDFYEAEKYFNLAIENNNQFPDPYFHRGELYLKKFTLYYFPDFNESKNFLTKSIQDLKSALKIRYEHKWNDLLNEAKNISRNYYRLSKQEKNLWGKKIDKRGWENEFDQWFENL